LHFFLSLIAGFARNQVDIQGIRVNVVHSKNLKVGVFVDTTKNTLVPEKVVTNSLGGIYRVKTLVVFPGARVGG
jgi:hypothetical protein